MKSTDIIDQIVDTEKTNRNVRLVIPALIRWAELGDFSRTYGDIDTLLGYKKYSGIGHLLGMVQRVIQQLSEIEKQKIPTLNSLCKNKGSMLPSEGFTFVSPDYEDMDKQSKKLFVKGLDLEAHNYPNWDWVLNELGLKPATPITDEELESVTLSSFAGGEGEEHKTLKEYIQHHPESIGIHNVVKAETEYQLPSGDRLDVYFELKNGDCIAVELKPSISPENDISRGIFQCVKYSAVLNAIRTLKCQKYKVRSLLVTVGKVTDLNLRLAKELHVEFEENFAITDKIN